MNVEMTDLKVTDVDGKIDIDDIVQYNICCSKTSKGFINFISKMFISLVVITFSISMIYSYPDNDNSIHYSLISSIMAVYINRDHDIDNKK
jgi:hypothetical protein